MRAHGTKQTSHLVFLACEVSMCRFLNNGGLGDVRLLYNQVRDSSQRRPFRMCVWNARAPYGTGTGVGYSCATGSRSTERFVCCCSPAHFSCATTARETLLVVAMAKTWQGLGRLGDAGVRHAKFGFNLPTLVEETRVLCGVTFG